MHNTRRVWCLQHRPPLLHPHPQLLLLLLLQKNTLSTPRRTLKRIQRPLLAQPPTHRPKRRQRALFLHQHNRTRVSHRRRLSTQRMPRRHQGRRQARGRRRRGRADPSRHACTRARARTRAHGWRDEPAHLRRTQRKLDPKTRVFLDHCARRAIDDLVGATAQHHRGSIIVAIWILEHDQYAQLLENAHRFGTCGNEVVRRAKHVRVGAPVEQVGKPAFEFTHRRR